MAEFVVVGLGTFGRNVAMSLAEHGQSVLAVDRNEDEIRKVSHELDAVVSADATDEFTLRELGLDKMSCAVVAIGAESMEASILTTALLRQLGVPRIVARGLTELHARVLYAVGAHMVINPEAEMGRRLARQLAEPNVLDRFDLGENAEIAEVDVPEAFVGKTVVELDVRREYGVSVVAIRRGRNIMAAIEGNEKFESGDALVVVGTPAAIRRVASLA